MACKRGRTVEACGGALTVGGFVVMLLMMLSLGMRRGVNHDESQHLAAGAVFGRHLLLPYRDFPYFHMPDLVLIYGVLFRWCGWLLLVARGISVVAGWVTCLLVWEIVWRECRGKAAALRWMLAGGAVLLLFSNPIFREAFWRTWNHSLGTLFAMVAVGLAMRGGRWFWTGAFIGLAIGTRLTFAPLIAPLGLAVVLEPVGGNLRERVRRVAAFGVGAAGALLPAMILCAMAPAQFLFGNFTFNSKVNVLFRQSYHDPRITLGAKMRFPFATLLADRANLVLTVIFVLLVGMALVRVFKMPSDARYRLLLVLGLIPFALIGAMAASPSQHEYYYALVPLIVLGVAISVAALPAGRMSCLCVGLVLGGAIYTTSRSWDEYDRIAILRRPSEWPPVRNHEAGIEAARWVHGGRVLTLEPLQALEGGLDIYPSLVTGGIAWRTEPFVTPGDRARFQVLGPDNFAAMLGDAPPAGVLTTPSSELDGPLIAWARAHGYAAHLLENRGKMVDRATIWTPAEGAAP